VVGLEGFPRRIWVGRTHGRVAIDSEESVICSRCRSRRDIVSGWNKCECGVQLLQRVRCLLCRVNPRFPGLD
jgi:hypothetical protein